MKKYRREYEKIMKTRKSTRHLHRTKGRHDKKPFRTR